MKENSKGFTLIELLAVIVVLAIIMVIATTQVNKTIKKARTNAFDEMMTTVVKSAKSLIAEDSLKHDDLRDSLDYSSKEYNVEVSGEGPWIITLTATKTGKFKNVDFSLIDKNENYTYNTNDKTIAILIDSDGNVSNYVNEAETIVNSTNKGILSAIKKIITDKGFNTFRRVYVCDDDGASHCYDKFSYDKNKMAVKISYYYDSKSSSYFSNLVVIAKDLNVDFTKNCPSNFHCNPRRLDITLDSNGDVVKK